MFSKPFDRNSKEWKRFVAWGVGSLTAPVVAYPFIVDATPELQLDWPILFLFGFCWSIVSFSLYLFVKSNIK